ncbi:protein NDNF [Bacillus rossius redtenbacheri]|uniref:protein NDNF n=1 Tax=Bacillus rossius redtenbacheri TaxID=93214 RepID=UPI002FDDF193
MRAPGRAAGASVVAALVLAACAAAAGQDPGPKARRPPYRFDLPKNDIFRVTAAIPDNHQVSAFLFKGETKLFFYEQRKKDSGLFIAVTPCTSSVAWSVLYRNHSDAGDRLADVTVASLGAPLESNRGADTEVFAREHAPPGLYVLEVTPLERESYVQFYATEDPGGPAALSVPHRARLRLRRRGRRRQLAVSWEQSKVDPHVTQYCLAVNARRHYRSLCEARGEAQGVAPPPPAPRAPGFDPRLERAQARKSELASKAARAGRGLKADLLVECVGRRTQYTLTQLEHGKVYHFDVFGVNRKTNLSFPYGRAALKYDQRSRPAALRDAKAARVNLRKLDGRATFKFKVGRQAPGPLQMYVMPCGGAVDAEVTSQGKVVVARRRVEGYDVLRVADAARGQRFLLKVVARDPDELSRISALEVLATARGDAGFPLPAMPQERRLHEFPGLSDCRSVTLGWLPSPDPAARYCVSAAELRRGWDEAPGATPDQCAAERRRPQHCLARDPAANSTVMTHRVRDLKPGRGYVVQVTAKKLRGKALAYDLLQVVTKDSCS